MTAPRLTWHKPFDERSARIFSRLTQDKGFDELSARIFVPGDPATPELGDSATTVFAMMRQALSDARHASTTSAGTADTL